MAIPRGNAASIHGTITKGPHLAFKVCRRFTEERSAETTLRLLILAVFSIFAYSFLFVSWLDIQPYTIQEQPLFPVSSKKLSNTQWPEVFISAEALNARKTRTSRITSVIAKTHKMKNVRALCDIPVNLGPVPVNASDIDLDVVERKYAMVRWGGKYSPHYCTARHRVAIIVPYRDRKKNLATFLNHMHPFLIKQKLEYGIYIIEQSGKHEFNRGKLMNVGFSEAGDWQCFIFHDIDLLPLDGRNFYNCPHQKYPRLLDTIVGLDKNELRLAVRGSFGGVSALTKEQFAKVNGYSNGYWGWGGEDNDLYYRLTRSGYTVTQYDLPIARYVSIHHKQKSSNPKRYRLLLQTIKAFEMDGLSNLQYQLVSITRHHLYTHILVNVDHTYHELQELFNEHYKFENLKFDIVSRMEEKALNYTRDGTETDPP